jgi:hypothetical protein
MVRMQWVVCPSCRHGHTFSLRIDEPAARAYRYVCPETGLPSAIGLRGQWEAADHPAQGAVVLTPIPAFAEAPAA